MHCAGSATPSAGGSLTIPSSCHTYRVLFQLKRLKNCCYYPEVAINSQDRLFGIQADHNERKDAHGLPESNSLANGHLDSVAVADSHGRKPSAQLGIETDKMAVPELLFRMESPFGVHSKSSLTSTRLLEWMERECAQNGYVRRTSNEPRTLSSNAHIPQTKSGILHSEFIKCA